MRKNRRKIKLKPQETSLTPWQPNSPEISIYEQIQGMSLQHTMPALEDQSKEQNEELKGWGGREDRDGRERERRIREAQRHGKTLSVIKNYCKKFYTEPLEILNPHKPKPRQKSSELLDKLANYIPFTSPYPTHKVAVVDLNQSLNRSIPTKLKKRPQSAGSGNNKILKIQSMMTKQKHSLKECVVESEQLKKLRPCSRTATIHRVNPEVSISPYPRKRVVYPVNNFGQLLHTFLKSR